MSTLYSDFIEETIGDLGRDTTVIRGLFDRWTNDSIKEIYRDTNLWLSYRTLSRTINANKRSYPLPDRLSDTIVMYALTSDGLKWGPPINAISERRAIMLYAPADIGSPKAFSLGKNSFSMWPMPDATYFLRVKMHSYEDPLTTTDASKQTSDLIDEFKDAVKSKVLSKGFRHMEEFEKAKYYRDMYEGTGEFQGVGEKQKIRRKNAVMILTTDITITVSPDARGAPSR